jgi:sugar lactone lactonase YvrE
MGIAGETLYVTDIERLHAVDKKTGKISRTIEVPGAKLLNDIAIDANGKVYVSDMVTRKVHRLEGEKGDKLPVFVDTSAFKGANGLLVQGGDLLVGSEQGIVKVDLANAKATLHVPVKGLGVSPEKPRFFGARGDGTSPLNVYLLDTTADKVQSADFEYIADHCRVPPPRRASHRRSSRRGST